MSSYDYNQQAKEFLAKANAKMTITYICHEINKDWGDNFTRPKYRVTITTPKGRTWFYFWGNAMGNPVREYDVLACLEKYDYGSFHDFCHRFCYCEEEYIAKKLYNNCVRQYRSLCRIFTPEQMEELREIY